MQRRPCSSPLDGELLAERFQARNRLSISWARSTAPAGPLKTACAASAGRAGAVREHVEVGADVARRLAHGHRLAEVNGDQAVAALAGRGQAVHVVDLNAAPPRRLVAAAELGGEAVVRDHVGPRIEQHAIARQSVAAGASDLLIVAFDRARHVPVDDVADIGFVDAHAERNGGDHHLELVARKGVLEPIARRRFHAGVVGGGADAALAQMLGQRLARLPRQRIDDAALPAARLDQPRDGRPHAFATGAAPAARSIRLTVAALPVHRDVQVGPEEAAAVAGRVDHRQLGDDVGRDLWRGGGGERQHRYAARPATA